MSAIGQRESGGSRQHMKVKSVFISLSGGLTSQNNRRAPQKQVNIQMGHPSDLASHRLKDLKGDLQKRFIAKSCPPNLCADMS